jgi:hypothetical protein
MGSEHLINEQARKTGQTREEILKEARAVLLGQEAPPQGLRGWVGRVVKSLRPESEQDRANRRVFEERRARDQEERTALELGRMYEADPEGFMKRAMEGGPSDKSPRGR